MVTGLKAKHLFILIGNDKTGKTTLQKLLIDKMTDKAYPNKLQTNTCLPITHGRIARKYEWISFGNRSYQEKQEYKSVENYFANFFKDADIAFISSHLNERNRDCQEDIAAMITEGKKRFYNVVGVFWSNSIAKDAERNSNISLLNWDTRIVLDNPEAEDKEQINKQLNILADDFVHHLVRLTELY